MDNFSFLQKYQRLQYKVMFDQIIDSGFAQLGYCEVYDSPFWNLALTNKVLAVGELQQIEKIFVDFKRRPAVYFINSPKLQKLKDFLTNRDYQKDYEDSWMFYQKEVENLDGFDQIKKVENEDDLNIFLDTFDHCYIEDDPQNPYGELGDYLIVAKNSWYQHHSTNRLKYFIAYKDDHPVAVATLNNYEGVGYISNVGSLKEVRGEGFGKLVTLYCVYQSQKRGNKIHCLATEEGTYPNKFYTGIGFKTLFTSICYVK